MSSAGFKNSVGGLSHWACSGSGCSANLLPETPFATTVTGVIACRTITTSCMWCAATPEAGKGALWFGGLVRGFEFDCSGCRFVCCILTRCDLVQCDSSSCCLVIADSLLRLASKSQALLITCAKVRVVRFSREMRSLLK